MLGIIHGLGFSHHGQSVAILQYEVVGSQQFDVAPEHPAHVHAIGVAQFQVAQLLAVKS